MIEQTPVSDSTNTEVELARLRAQVTALLALQDIAWEVTADLDLDRLLHKILRAAVTVMHGTAGSLLLYYPATSELVFEVVEGGGGAALEKTRIPCNQGIAGATFTRGQPIIVDNVERDKRHLGNVASRFGVQVETLIAVPLIAKGKTVGVLEVMNKSSGDSFNLDDQDLLLAFASQSAIAIENARLYRRVIKERDRILYVEAGVRREVARDLHDGPAQMLSAIIMGLRVFGEVIKHKPNHIESELAELTDLAEKSLYQIRNILFAVRPVILEKQGLGATLEAYVERLRPQESFNIELETDSLKTRFSPAVEFAIFSTVQEAVNNAHKHAAPQTVWIKAGEDDTQLTITVQDDGNGFDLNQVDSSYAERNSFGLLNMRERAEIAHGTIKIESQPGRGTTITLRVPLAPPTSDEGTTEI